MDRKNEITHMADAAAFEDADTLKTYLAQQLSRGRLALVLGAGISMGFGLPNWDVLTAEVARDCGFTPPPGISNEDVGDGMLRHLGDDEVKFAAAVRRGLYGTLRFSMQDLVGKPLLVALGALTMASQRGSVSKILSFNFDDLLEKYLGYHGYVVESVGKMPYWASAADVRVFHPHGILPSDPDRTASPIVFTQGQYDRIVGKADYVWRRLALDLICSNTCLFIGLSGRDNNLKSILTEAHPVHPATVRGDAFWGVRFSDRVTDPMRDTWYTRGVGQISVARYEEVPAYLLEVCQRAAEASRAHRGL
jgi:hypothetical protein